MLPAAPIQRVVANGMKLYELAAQEDDRLGDNICREAFGATATRYSPVVRQPSVDWITGCRASVDRFARWSVKPRSFSLPVAVQSPL
jgi:hypothetical protein